jgi:hypothetical protein
LKKYGAAETHVPKRETLHSAVRFLDDLGQFPSFLSTAAYCSSPFRFPLAIFTALEDTSLKWLSFGVSGQAGTTDHFEPNRPFPAQLTMLGFLMPRDMPV